MTPNEYQKAASRTECNHIDAKVRIYGFTDGNVIKPTLTFIRLNQAALGICKEGGELGDIVEKSVYFGHPLDKNKVLSEIGDVLWYVALALNALDLSLEDAMTYNIQKLMERFPDKFDSERAKAEVKNNPQTS